MCDCNATSKRTEALAYVFMQLAHMKETKNTMEITYPSITAKIS